MLAVRLIAVLVAATTPVLLWSCAASGPTAAKPALADPYVGDWRSDEGVTVSIRHDATPDQYRITSNRSGATRDTEGTVIDIDGTAVAMIKVFDPTEDQRKTGAVPLYLFGILNREGDTLRHTPIRPEWLRQQINSRAGARYIDSSSVSQGTGVGVVSDWGDMEDILRKAMSSKDATGQTEVFKRVK